MEKSKISYLFNSSFIFLTILFLTGCQENEDDLPVYDITGEWLRAYNDSYKVSISTIEFTSEGVYKEWNAYISRESNSNLKYEGTYSNNGKIDIVYTTKYINEYYPRQFHSVYRILQKNKYMLHLYDEAKGVDQIYRKVAEVFNMTVGEQKSIVLSNVDLHNAEFISCDTKVAEVNNQGEIYAVKRGTTYIRVISSEGEFAIRVEIVDNNNLADNYIRHLGGSIVSVLNDMGDMYEETLLDSCTTQIRYNVIDNLLRRIYFRYFVENRVYVFGGDFLDGINIDKIIESFDHRYEKRSVDKPYLHKYNYIFNGHEIEIIIDEKKRTLHCELIPSELERFDGYITKSIDEVVRWEGKDFPYPSDELGYIKVDLEVPKYVETVEFLYDEDTRDIMAIWLTCKKDINRSEVYRWYNEHYIKITEEDDLLQENEIMYSPTSEIMMTDYYIIIKESDSIQIRYANRKIM